MTGNFLTDMMKNPFSPKREPVTAKKHELAEEEADIKARSSYFLC